MNREDKYFIVIIVFIGLMVWNTGINFMQTEWIKQVSDDENRHYQSLKQTNNEKLPELTWTMKTCTETVYVIQISTGESWYECVSWK